MQHPLLPQPPGRPCGVPSVVKAPRRAHPNRCRARGPASWFARMRVVPNRDQVLDALRAVIDPELRRSIVELEMVRTIDIGDGGEVDVTVSLTTPGCPIRNHFQTAVAQAVGALEGVQRVNVAF